MEQRRKMKKIPAQTVNPGLADMNPAGTLEFRAANDGSC
jgi:hypothetical protein